MSNFQHLAEKVLTKKNNKVSCSLPLIEETGNFQGKTGNNTGNYEKVVYIESRNRLKLSNETNQETHTKQVLINEETQAVKNIDKSFLAGKCPVSILEQFFSNASRLNIHLLQEDKSWIKDIVFGAPPSKLTSLLSQYIDQWLSAMVSEPVVYKKQNVGRRAANTWLRNTLIIQRKQ